MQFGAGATAATLPFERDLALVAGPFFATFVAALVPGYSLVTTAHGDGYITKLRAMPAERFEIGDFHNVALGNGMTPLNQLARTIEA